LLYLGRQHIPLLKPLPSLISLNPFESSPRRDPAIGDFWENRSCSSLSLSGYPQIIFLKYPMTLERYKMAEKFYELERIVQTAVLQFWIN